MQQIDIAQAQSNLPKLFEAAIGGEEIIITQDNKPLLKLSLIEAARPNRKAGSAQGLITLAADFNDSYEELSEEPL